MPQWVAEANRLREALPPEVQETLRRHEAAGTTADSEYETAMLVFYRRHVCRLDPWPAYVTRTFESAPSGSLMVNSQGSEHWAL